ncbi:MAG: hypothetical protein HYX48_02675 [Chlamydiales bacterium]|nr:hypothetical protein [Chlamydiales bacterium]
MEFQGKALYNLVRISWLEEPSIVVEPWQVEDLRSASLETLFARLETLGIELSPEAFLVHAEESQDPEELIDHLYDGVLEDAGYEQSYLLIFELWRRLLPQKFALSVFCDELDWRIYLYDRELLSQEHLQEVISDLEDLLDESVDNGAEPKEIFLTLESFCAHDLERFLYDYATGLIDGGEDLDASELIDEFYIYIEKTNWFDFLRARLLAPVDLEESVLVLERLLLQLEEEPDVDLLFEITTYLVTQGDPALFQRCIKLLMTLIDDEEKFQALVKLVVEYFCCLDLDTHHKSAQEFLSQRQNRSLDAPVDASDFKSIYLLLENSQGKKI